MTYAYDKRGNLNLILENGTVKNRYTYGALNRLEQAVKGSGEAASYRYNGLGYRIGKEEYKVSHSNELKMFTHTFSESTRKIGYLIDFTKQYNNLLQKEEMGEEQNFIWDGNVVGMQCGDENSCSYFLQDELGSSIRLINISKFINEIYDYNEFGQELYENRETLQLFRYTGYQKDNISETLFAQAREYLPEVGRFCSSDLIKGNQNDPNSLNEYLYCQNEPMQHVDLNGMFVLATLAIIGVGAVVGGAVSGVLNAVNQGIRIAQGKQESFQKGALIGSVVEGAIVGGAGAIPGVGFLVTVGAGGVGAAANSAISQKVDEGTIDGWKVLEDGVIGAVSAGLFYGIGKIVQSFKGENMSGIKEQYALTAENLERNIFKMKAINAAGKTASSLTRRTQTLLKEELKLLLRKYAYEQIEKNLSKGAVSSVLSVIGVKTGKTLIKELISILSPIYKDSDELTAAEYLQEYFGDIFEKLTQECDG